MIDAMRSARIRRLMDELGVDEEEAEFIVNLSTARFEVTWKWRMTNARASDLRLGQFQSRPQRFKMAHADTDLDRQCRIQEVTATDGVDVDEANWLIDLVDGVWRGDIAGPNGMSDEERVALGLPPWPIPSGRPTPTRTCLQRGRTLPDRRCLN